MNAALVFALSLVAQPGDAAIPKNAAKELAYYVGDWKGTTTFQGQMTPASWKSTWAPGKFCVVIHEEYVINGQKSQVTVLFGWDRIKKRLTNWGLRGDGGNRTLIYDEGFLKGSVVGDMPDGTPFKGRFFVTKVNAKEMKIKLEATDPKGAGTFVIHMTK